MITGTVLVLLSWTLVIGLLLCLGGAAALLASPRTNRSHNTPSSNRQSSKVNGALVRSALWWGLAVATVIVLVIGLWQPLTSGATAGIILVAAAVMAGLAIVVARAQGRRIARPSARNTGRWQWALIGALTLGIAYLAVAALGPVTNYDTGLYHLGVIKYDSQYSTIPGLANLFFPFGYNTSQFPLAAVLGNGPWDGIGYRLLNGLMVTLMAADLAIRVLGRRFTVGTYVLIVGALAAWVPMIALSDYWVTSPSSDSAVFVLTVVASAYLADALWSSTRWQADAAVALVLALLMFGLRPLMIAYLGGVACVLALHLIRQVRRNQPSTSSPAPTSQPKVVWALVAALAAALLVVQTVRDYLLSGWIQYPLSLFAFDVPWVAGDPWEPRTATLGAARDPSRLWDAAAGWDWIPAWIGRLPQQWEIFEIAALVLLVVIVAVFVRRRGLPWRPRVLALAVAPSAATTLAWFVAAPPAFRFAWGPAFTLFAIPIGWGLFALARSGRGLRRGSRPGSRSDAIPMPLKGAIAGFCAGTVLLVGYCAVARLDTGSMIEDRTWRAGPIAIGYRTSPITKVPINEVELDSGLLVRVPEGTDQCWDAYPLCSPQMLGSLAGRSSDLQDGLLPVIVSE
jgi:hypothetical protein